jgi:hypothetical protein
MGSAAAFQKVFVMSMMGMYPHAWLWTAKEGEIL